MTVTMLIDINDYLLNTMTLHLVEPKEAVSVIYALNNTKTTVLDRASISEILLSQNCDPISSPRENLFPAGVASCNAKINNYKTFNNYRLTHHIQDH